MYRKLTVARFHSLIAPVWLVWYGCACLWQVYFVCRTYFLQLEMHIHVGCVLILVERWFLRLKVFKLYNLLARVYLRHPSLQICLVWSGHQPVSCQLSLFFLMSPLAFLITHNFMKCSLPTMPNAQKSPQSEATALFCQFVSLRSNNFLCWSFCFLVSSFVGHTPSDSVFLV